MSTREKIILAFKELAEKQGFYKVTMDELAVKAGISKRTIYRYFRQKEEIVEAVLDTYMSQVVQEIDEVFEKEEQLEKIISKILYCLINKGRFLTNSITIEDLRKHYSHLWVKIENFRAQRIQSLGKIILDKSTNPNIKQIDQRILITVILVSIQTILNPHYLIENRMTFEEAAEQLGKLLVIAFLR